MDFPTAGLCQEVCLASNLSTFGVQVTLSVCHDHLVFTNLSFLKEKKREKVICTQCELTGV